MAGTKTTALGSLILPAANDLFPVVDVSDTSMAASGTTKGIAQDKLTVFGMLNVKGYGASGSATTTTGSINASSATLTLAAAIDFVNGQGILVAGAGAAGADLVTTISSGAGTTTLTLATTAGTTVAGVLTQHDDTVAVRAAIDAAVAAGGGTVFFPDGTYNLEKDFSVNSALLNIATSSPEGVIRLAGASGGWLNPASTGSGAIFKTVRLTGTGANALIRGAGGTTIYLESITIRTIPNPTTQGIDMSVARGTSISNVIVETGNGQPETTEPTNGTYAIKLPIAGNYGLTSLFNVTVTGFAFGVQVSEHTTLRGVVISRTIVGLEATATPVGDIVGDVFFFDCAKGITATGIAFVRLVTGHEYAGGPAWSQEVAQIYDPSNNLRGWIDVHPTSLTLTKNGATGVMLYNPAGRQLRGALTLETPLEIDDFSANGFTLSSSTAGSTTDTVQIKNVVAGNQFTQLGLFPGNTNSNNGVFVVIRPTSTASSNRVFFGIDNANARPGVLISEGGDFSFRGGPYPGTEALKFNSSGDTTAARDLFTTRNLFVKGVAAGSSADGVLIIANGTPPGSSPPNCVQLYAEDEASSSELKVRDEAGNITPLSPHNFSLIPEGPSEELAWAYYGERDGKAVNVDMLKLARIVERMTGEQLVFIKSK